MKKLLLYAMLLIFMLSVPAHAQMAGGMTGEQKSGMCQQGMMMGEEQQMPMMNCPKMQQMQGQGMMQGGQQMPMMQMCMPMMQQMMGQGMMIRDMMQMMKDVMKMQEKIVKGVSPAEKKEMLKEMDKMMERMDRMMSDMRCTCMRGATGPPVETKKEVQKKEEQQKEETPKTDPHGH
jgi:hypothetical protein